MPGKKPLAVPGNAIYIYDGSIAGFYCCVHECVYSHELPSAVYSLDDAEPSLFAEKWIHTDYEKAQKVRDSIPRKISLGALSLVETVFLSCMDKREMAMIQFLLLGYQEGKTVVNNLGHAFVAPMIKAERHLLGEAHHLKGFLRFSDYKGMLVAQITPKNFVLPFLRDHFIDRYSQESFLIYDKTHKTALAYEKGKSHIFQLEEFTLNEVDEKEQGYQALWKRFYNTIAIEERVNPKLRMTNMPKRFWPNMVEMKEFL